MELARISLHPNYTESGKNFDVAVLTVKDKIKVVTERAALLKLTSNAMVKASADFVSQCQSDGRKWQRLLVNEREIRQRLEDMVEQLARQHSHLEHMVKREHEHQQLQLNNSSNHGHNNDQDQVGMQI